VTPEPGRCKSCHAQILWVVMESEKLMPCDPAPVTIVSREGKVVSGFISHFATCPNAAQHRKAAAT
jgi:hypothetical protein